jgi:hypothetical protein
LKLPGKLNQRKEKDRREYEGKKNSKKKKKLARRGGNGGGREPPKKLPNSEPPNSMVSRVPNKRSHPGNSWKNKFIFVTLKIHQVLSILSCGALAAPPWGLDILRNTMCLHAKVP